LTRFAFYEQTEGIQTPEGNVVAYDVMRNTAVFGSTWIEGHALVWEVGQGIHAEPKLSVEVELDPATPWLIRCDRVDFPAGGVAYLHTHPGPGIRCLLFGELHLYEDSVSHTYGPFGAWFEAADHPVFAAASPTQEAAFVRVMLLPREWEGQRTIRYLNPEDEGQPKTQRATVFLERPLVF
jgi:hypothetical protein